MDSRIGMHACELTPAARLNWHREELVMLQQKIVRYEAILAELRASVHSHYHGVSALLSQTVCLTATEHAALFYNLPEHVCDPLAAREHCAACNRNSAGATAGVGDGGAGAIGGGSSPGGDAPTS
jgi:hypothetical protein